MDIIKGHRIEIINNKWLRIIDGRISERITIRISSICYLFPLKIGSDDIKFHLNSIRDITIDYHNKPKEYLNDDFALLENILLNS